MKYKKILITGVAGFIGSAIAKKLIELNYEVHGIDNLSSGKIENIPKGIIFSKKDISKEKKFNFLPNDIDCIMHLAGQSSGEISFENPISDLQKNTIATLNLISFANNTKVDKFIYASSMSVYGDVKDEPIAEYHETKPLSCYGVGKLASENYLRILLKKSDSFMMRMFNVYGPGQDFSNMKQGMVSIFLSQALKSKKIIVKGSLDRFRDFIHIDDVVELWIKTMKTKEEGFHELNIGSGKKTSVEELLKYINEVLGPLDIELEGSTPGDQMGIFSDNSKIKKMFKKKNFIGLDQGINHVLKSEIPS